MNTTLQCFLLTTSYRDINGRFEITLHAATAGGKPLTVLVDNFRPMFFVPRQTPVDVTAACAERKALPMRTMDGLDVDCLYFATNAAARDAAVGVRAAGVHTYESDVNPVLRYLMERMVRGGFECEGEVTERVGRLNVRNPRVRGIACDVPLRVLSLDIENNVATGELYSIACCGAAEQVFLRGDIAARPSLSVHPDERSLLRAFLEFVATTDPDVLIGWSVVDYDLRMLEERCRACGIPFTLGRGAVARVTPTDRPGVRYNARVPGRAVMDVPSTLRSYNYTFEEYSLDFVAGEMLGEHKSITAHGREKIAEIDRQFREDPLSLARYNLQDARLTLEIFNKAGLLPNAVERSRRSGHLLDRTGGSIAAFDYLYLPLLHRAGHVACDLADVAPPTRSLTGGFIMDPAPGIYRNVAVLDFRSLYPSIMMTFLIDPLGLVRQSGDRVTSPVGTSFARDAAILPGIIRELMSARDEAKRLKNPYLSQAIKIIMNSFYGVLGTPQCRFFAADLAQTITETGQFVFKQTAAHIEQATSYRVIYGDTDSMFVHLGEGHDSDGEQEGRRIVAEVNAWLSQLVKQTYATESALLLQFEQHYHRFLIPPLRGGGGEGSKKHYCGAVIGPNQTKLTFKGMESARSDWTDLAKEFQHELCMRLFDGRPVDQFVLDTVARVKAGGCDDKLVYRKRLRKDLDTYVDNVPPHAQAARMLDSPGGLIRYVMTVEGPQPLEKRRASLDYEHYIETQLAPVADTLLGFAGLDFGRLVSGQQDLFGPGRPG